MTFLGEGILLPPPPSPPPPTANTIRDAIAVVLIFLPIDSSECFDCRFFMV